jgi:hypothetical protein
VLMVRMPLMFTATWWSPENAGGRLENFGIAPEMPPTWPNVVLFVLFCFSTLLIM